MYTINYTIKGRIAMGLINNIREFFSDSKNTQPAQANVNEE